MVKNYSGLIFIALLFFSTPAFSCGTSDNPCGWIYPFEITWGDINNSCPEANKITERPEATYTNGGCLFHVPGIGVAGIGAGSLESSSIVYHLPYLMVNVSCSLKSVRSYYYFPRIIEYANSEWLDYVIAFCQHSTSLGAGSYSFFAVKVVADSNSCGLQSGQVPLGEGGSCIPIGGAPTGLAAQIISTPDYFLDFMKDGNVIHQNFSGSLLSDKLNFPAASYSGGLLSLYTIPFADDVVGDVVYDLLNYTACYESSWGSMICPEINEPTFLSRIWSFPESVALKETPPKIWDSIVMHFQPQSGSGVANYTSTDIDYSLLGYCYDEVMNLSWQIVSAGHDINTLSASVDIPAYQLAYIPQELVGQPLCLRYILQAEAFLYHSGGYEHIVLDRYWDMGTSFCVGFFVNYQPLMDSIASLGNVFPFSLSIWLKDLFISLSTYSVNLEDLQLPLPLTGFYVTIPASLIIFVRGLIFISLCASFIQSRLKRLI